MRAAWGGVAAAIYDGEFSFVVEGLEGGKAGVEAEMIVETDDVLFGDADFGASFVVGVIREGDDGVEAIVAAGELHDDEHALAVAHVARVPE